MIGLWSVLRPHALLGALGLATAVAAWLYAQASARLAAAEDRIAESQRQRDADRAAHAAEIQRLEAHHLAELDRARRLAYALAAQREQQTLSDPPSAAGAQASAARRQAYRALLGEGTHDR